MSELAFSELQSQVEALPYYQMLILQKKLNSPVEKEKERESESFVSEGLSWLNEIAGSVHREIDYKKEMEEWRGDFSASKTPAIEPDAFLKLLTTA